MAPKRAMKAASPQAKKAKTEKQLLKDKIEKVGEALRNAEYAAPNTPMDVRELLATCGSCALHNFVEDRHEFETRMVGMVEGVIKEIRGKLQANVNEQKHFAENADNVKKQHETDLAAGQDNVEKKKEEIANRTETKNTDSDALGQAIDASFKATEAAELADTAKERVTGEKAEALLIYNECFVVLRDNPQVDGNAKLLQRLEAQMEGMEVVDESLQKAAPNALVKEIGDRGAFDNMALSSLDQIFKKFDTDSAYTIENSDSLAAAAHRKKDELKAAMDAAEAKKQASVEALAQAKKELQELQKGVKEHEKALKGHDKKVADIEKEIYKAEAELEVFDEGTLAVFTELKDRVKPPPEPEEVEEEAAEEVAEDEAAGGEEANADA